MTRHCVTSPPLLNTASWCEIQKADGVQATRLPRFHEFTKTNTRQIYKLRGSRKRRAPWRGLSCAIRLAKGENRHRRTSRRPDRARYGRDRRGDSWGRFVVLRFRRNKKPKQWSAAYHQHGIR